MEMIYFAVVAIVLYFAAGWILDRIESHLGRRLEQRSIAFFFILLVLAILVFSAINRLFPG